MLENFYRWFNIRSAAFLRVHKKGVRFSGCLILIFFCTYWITNSLYPYNQKILLPSSGSNIDVSQFISDSNRFSISAALADSLQVPFGLDWYDINIENNSQRLLDQDCFQYDLGSPAVEITFNSINDTTTPNKYTASSDLVPFTEYENLVDGLSHSLSQQNNLGIYVVELNKTGTLTYGADKPLTYKANGVLTGYKIISTDGKCAQLVASSTYKMAASLPADTVYASPNHWAWWMKFTILFFLLCTLLSVFLTLWNLL
ncbi:MAG: hypothetical protein WCF77_04605 [Minisyncoccia bacterium]|jgi:hypothetical protein